MGCTRAVKECLRQVACALHPSAARATTVGPATAADPEAPQVGHSALHDHG